MDQRPSASEGLRQPSPIAGEGLRQPSPIASEGPANCVQNANEQPGPVGEPSRWRSGSVGESSRWRSGSVGESSRWRSGSVGEPSRWRSGSVGESSRWRRGSVAFHDRLLLLVLSVIVLLPGVFGVSLTDRDEGWYAQVSREMLQSDDWVIPRYLGQPWIAKPPLLYWCVAGMFALAGVHAWAARLVSVAAMILAVQLIASLGARLYGPAAARAESAAREATRRTGFLAAAAFITAALPAIVGKLVLTDALLLVWICAAAVLLWEIWHRPNAWVLCIAFWICIGLGVLTKGPAVVLFVGALAISLAHREVSIVSVARSWFSRPRLRPRRADTTARADATGRADGTGRADSTANPLWPLLATCPIALGVAAPWYVLAASRAGEQLWAQFLGFEVMSRLTGAPHGHGGPPGYYLILTLAAWLPWSPLLPGAVLEAWQARRTAPVPRAADTSRDRSDPSASSTRLLLLWLALPWLALELIPSKLPHYILPCYVPLALLVGRMWDVGLDRPVDARQAVVLRVWTVVIGLTAAGPAILAWRAWPSAAATGLVALAAVLLAGAAAIGLAVGRRRLGQAFALAILIGAAFHAGLGLLVLPALEPYRLSREIARRANSMAAPGTEVLVAGYTEPTLFFYLDRPARLVKAEEIAGRFSHARARTGAQEREPRVYIVREDLLDAADVRADVPAERWDQVCGFNYVKGRSECVWVGPRHVK